MTSSFFLSSGNGLENNGQENENKFITVPGREGNFMMSESIHDKYTNRPIGVEKLTLSQFATCYTKCKKKPKDVTLNDLDVSEKMLSILPISSYLNTLKHLKMNSLD